MPDVSGDVQETKEVNPLTDLINCPKCGHSNPAGSRYCDNCGASLVGVEPQAPQAEAKTKRNFFARLFGRR